MGDKTICGCLHSTRPWLSISVSRGRGQQYRGLRNLVAGRVRGRKTPHHSSVTTRERLSQRRIVMVKYDVYGCCFGQCHLVWRSHLISTCLRQARVVYIDVGRELSVWPIGKSASGRSCGRLYVGPFTRALVYSAVHAGTSSSGRSSGRSYTRAP